MYIDGVLNRQETTDSLTNLALGASTLPFPATADAVTYGFDRAISFDGRVDELRLWLNSGTTDTISTLASKANIGIKT